MYLTVGWATLPADQAGRVFNASTTGIICRRREVLHSLPALCRARASMQRTEALMRELHLRSDRSSPLVRSDEGTPDPLLIQRIAAGNRLAMQVLYLRHHLRVYRHITRIVSDHAATEDLLSDTFLDVWRKADTFRGHASVATWLLTIARNKSISA